MENKTRLHRLDTHATNTVDPAFQQGIDDEPERDMGGVSTLHVRNDPHVIVHGWIKQCIKQSGLPNKQVID